MKLILSMLLITVFSFVRIKCDSKLPFDWNGTNFIRKANNLTGDVAFHWGVNITRTFINAEEAAKLCLKNIDECIEEDRQYEIAAEGLANFLFAKAPPFDLSRNDKISFTCRQQSAKYLEDLKKFKFWALKMYDSSAKIPSGILNGNLNQLGDFDSCLRTLDKDNKIQGQYCLTSVQIEPEAVSPYVAALHRLVHSHFHFKSNLDESGHRLPRFSSIHWALCVPHGCSPNDVEIGVKDELGEILKNTGLEFRVQVEPEMCQTETGETISTPTIIAFCVFLAIILFEIAATVYDYVGEYEKNQWLMAFSLRKNIADLLTDNRSADDVKTIHGIRFFNASMLVFAHRSNAVFFVPYTNRTDMIEHVSQLWSVICRAASLYTDPFIMISGTLTTYSLLGKLQRNQKINLIEEYISRLLRIVPTLAGLIAFCAFILPILGSGPFWNLVITHPSDLCKKYWWRNLLFITNYFGSRDMCMIHSHHVATDTQLFFLSPLLVFLLYKWPKKGCYALTLLALSLTAVRYYVTYTMRLSNFVHFGASITQLYDSGDHTYMLPAHRLPVYILGIFLGYLLRNFRNISLTSAELKFGNTLAIFSFFMTVLGSAPMSTIDYVYNPTDGAWYSAITPILWCFPFAWIIFTAQIGHRGLFQRFFAWQPAIFFTKISYAVYLVQFPVFFSVVGTIKNAQYYTFLPTILILKQLLSIIFLSIVVTVMLEMPFQNIRNIIFKKKRAAICEEQVQKKLL